MKRVLFYCALLWAIGLFHQQVAGQTACPQFIDSTFRLIHPAGDPNPCDWQIRIEFYNPTMGVKSFKFAAVCGKDTVLNQCVDASHFKDSLRFDTSNVFTCCTLANLTVTLIAYTANSTICIGAACMHTYIQGAPLPVYFKEFDAAREGTSVNLQWITASEENNKGFIIDRKIGNKNWIPIAFVNSAAPGGTSSTDLNYSYADQNNTNEITLYRLKQVDLDGQFAYSQVLEIQGLKTNSSNVNIFPNPGKNGQITITFKDLSQGLILVLLDANGRLLQRWGNVQVNNFHITGLLPGWYNLLILEKGTGKQTVEKFVIYR